MKKIHPLLAGCMLLSTAFMVSPELPIGSTLPMADHKMKNIDGSSISLKDAMKENGLLVMFSCNTCPYVVKNQERTVATGKEAMQKNIGFIVINSNEGTRSDDDSFEAMKAYAKQQGYRWPYVVDAGSKIADVFGAKRTPECFLFNSKGKLVYHGAIDDNPTNASAINRRHLQEAMKEMVAGKDVTVSESRSVGCGIKRKS